MTADRTLRGLIASGRDDAIAIAAHEAKPLTYAGLRSVIHRTQRSLNELGIGRSDRVAIVLPNGPEMATAFLGVASATASAPLNPAYRQDEFEFYLEDLNAKALIIEAGSESPAIDAAERLGVALIPLAPEGPAGAFRLLGSEVGAAAEPGLAEHGKIVGAVAHRQGRGQFHPALIRQLLQRDELGVTVHDRLAALAGQLRAVIQQHIGAMQVEAQFRGVFR